MVDLADPVPEQVLVEVLGPVQVLLPRRHAGRRAVGIRPVLHDRLGRRIDAVRRDDVARERIPRPHVVHITAGRRVVDPDQVAGGIHQSREIAVLHRRRRHRAEQWRRRAFPVLLPGEQEEGLVPPDRTIQAEPVLIDVLVGLRCVARVEDVRVGGQRLAPHEVVDHAVEAVAARLERHVDDAAGGTPVLRVVRVRRDLYFMDGFRRRHVGDVVAALVGVIRRAVEQELVVAVLAAVHRPVGERAVVEGAQIDRRPVVGHAGDEHHERHRAARLERQLGDAGAVDDGAAVGAARLEERRLGEDGDFLGQPADAELCGDLGSLPDLQAHVGAGVLLKAAHLDGERVVPRAQERNGKAPFLVRRRRGDLVRVLVLDVHRRPGQRAATRIDDPSPDGGPELLGVGAGNGRQQHGRAEQAAVQPHSHHQHSSEGLSQYPRVFRSNRLFTLCTDAPRARPPRRGRHLLTGELNPGGKR